MPARPRRRTRSSIHSVASGRRHRRQQLAAYHIRRHIARDILQLLLPPYLQKQHAPPSDSTTSGCGHTGHRLRATPLLAAPPNATSTRRTPRPNLHDGPRLWQCANSGCGISILVRHLSPQTRTPTRRRARPRRGATLVGQHCCSSLARLASATHANDIFAMWFAMRPTTSICHARRTAKTS